MNFCWWYKTDKGKDKFYKNVPIKMYNKDKKFYEPCVVSAHEASKDGQSSIQCQTSHLSSHDSNKNLGTWIKKHFVLQVINLDINLDVAQYENPTSFALRYLL